MLLKFNIEDLCICLCFAVFYDGKLRHQYFYGSRRSSGFLIAQVLYMMIIKIFFLVSESDK